MPLDDFQHEFANTSQRHMNTLTIRDHVLAIYTDCGVAAQILILKLIICCYRLPRSNKSIYMRHTPIMGCHRSTIRRYDMFGASYRYLRDDRHARMPPAQRSVSLPSDRPTTIQHASIIQAADAECHFNDNGGAEIAPNDILYISRLHSPAHYCICLSLRHRCGCQIDLLVALVSRVHQTASGPATVGVALLFIIINILRMWPRQ